MNDADASAADVERLAPHGESGFSSVDVLEQAEEGDSAVVEMDFYDAAGIVSVNGTVTSVFDNSRDDDRHRVKHVTIEGHDGTGTTLSVLSDTMSAHNQLLEDVELQEIGQEKESVHKIDDLALCELERDA